MYCTKCGFDNGEEADFCGKCGQPMEIKSEPPMAASTWDIPQPASPAYASIDIPQPRKNNALVICLIAGGMLLIAASVLLLFI